MSKGLSRRGFFQAGAAAVASVATLGLAGCGEGQKTGSSETIKNTTTQKASEPSWLGEPPEVDEDEITETVDVDVVVVGCGTAGLPAIISAAEAGARVLGIESQSAIGNVREDLGAIDSKLQQETEKEFPQFHIDKMEAMEDIVRYANGFVNYDLVKLWADKSGAMIDWLTELIEAEGKYKMWHEGSIGTESDARDKAYATGHSPQALVDDEDLDFGVYLGQIAEQKGATIRYNTTFLKCEQNKLGRVTGIICRSDEDQHYLRVNAKGGVILATGGYGNNTAMMEARQPYNQRIRINVPGSGGNPSGDGIRAAMWCGATIDPTGAAVTFNRACVKPDEYAGSGTKGRFFWFGEQPFLKLNLNGKRFCNESGPYDYCLHSAYMQPHHMYVDIWDSDYVDKVKQIDEVGCCRLYPFDNGAPSNMPITLMATFFESLEEDGYLQKADTIEELAEKLNIPVDATKASFDRYNKFAEAGEDEDYNKEPYRLIKLDKPPYYGMRTGAWFLATIDGCPIDTDMHPVNEAGEPVDGLYVCGNDSGGFFSVSYPNLFTGLAAGRSMTFGRIAGQNAAAEAQA